MYFKRSVYRRIDLFEKKRLKAVTLIELVVVITIIGIIAFASSAYIKQVIDVWEILSFNSETVSQARGAILRMSREIREIKNDTSVYIANSGELKFLQATGSNIDFYLSNSNLMRNNDVLAEDISNLTFTYYDETNGLIAAPLISPYDTDIKMVVIEIAVQGGVFKKKLKNQVFPRNLLN